MINKKTILLLLFITTTIILCAWPNFHPEKYLGLKYSWQLDMLMHSFYYFLVTFFIYRIVVKISDNYFALTFIIFFAIVSELLQSFIPGRSFTFFDMASSITGVIGGYVLFLFLKLKGATKQT